MQQTILAISGKPGLYKLVSRGKMNLIVEALDDTHKRIPAFATDRVTSLADITMFTESEDLPLGTILARVRDKEACQEAPPSTGARHRQRNFQDYFASVVPDFDRDRVHNSDIKKLLQWYNILVAAGITDFEESMSQTEGDNIADRDDEAAQPAESKE